jgi:hypothetical protein
MENSNPMLSPWVRRFFIGVALVLSVGSALFFVPHLIGWPWPLTPFNTRFLGAVYLTALVVVLGMVIVNRWVPGRSIIPMALTFMLIISILSVLSLDRFDVRRKATWAWFVVYIGPTIVLASVLWRYRHLWGVQTEGPGGRWKHYLRGEAVALVAYGLGLLAAPGPFSAFWPWRLDAFHGRLYSAVFITFGLGAALLSRAAAGVEFLTLGLARVTLATTAVLGLVIVDASVHRVAWSAPNTWVWIGIFGWILASGAAMVRHAPALPTPASTPPR